MTDIAAAVRGIIRDAVEAGRTDLDKLASEITAASYAYVDSLKRSHEREHVEPAWTPAFTFDIREPGEQRWLDYGYAMPYCSPHASTVEWHIDWTPPKRPTGDGIQLYVQDPPAMSDQEFRDHLRRLISDSARRAPSFMAHLDDDAPTDPQETQP